MSRRAGRDRRAFAGVGAPPAPTPLTIFGASLVAWFDRTLGVTLGTPPEVAAWADQSGNANDASEATVSLRPTIDGTGISYDGTDDRLVVADDATLDVTTAMTIALKIAPAVVTGNRVPIARGPSTAGSFSFQTNGAAMRWHIGTPGAAFGQGGTMVASSTHTFIGRFDGAGGTNATRMRLQLDGSDLTLAFTGTIPATIPVGTDPIWLGGYTNGVQFWNGHIVAVVIASVVADAGEMSDLAAYLAGA